MVSRTLAATFAALALVVTMGAGCLGTEDSTAVKAGHTLTPIKGWSEFQRRVLAADRPVLMEFNKDPCPTCVVQQAELDSLAPEYSDRVFFASMTIMVGFFEVTEPEVRDKYNVKWVPTTILFVNGEEKKRWELNHTAFEIREELKKVVGEAKPKPNRASLVP